MNDQKNMILAIALSALVLIGWQYFIGMPQVEKQKQDAQLRQQQPTQTPPTTPPGTTPQASQPGSAQTTAPQAPGSTSTPASGQQMTREAAIAASPRVRVDTPSVAGSIALKGG